MELERLSLTQERGRQISNVTRVLDSDRFCGK
jgi:hypothetical protein